jgi:osmoprotectant transport system permease protein
VRKAGLWLTPLLLAAAAALVVAWAHRGELTPGEAAVLSGANLSELAREHVTMSAVSTALAALVAIPAGVVATRSVLRRLGAPVLFLANLGQTIPTVAVLALMLTVTGIGFRTAVLALWAYSLLPVLQNTLAGLRSVDPAVVEAARGMGMSPAQVLTRVELPLAWPVIMAGIRTAAVVNVGTAALATFIGAGGLGEVIQAGIANQTDRLLYAGASLTALLALAADWVAGLMVALTTAGLSRTPSAPDDGRMQSPTPEEAA